MAIPERYTCATQLDYEALPETGPRYQLIEGQLHMSPAPNRYHQDISRNLEFIIFNYLKTHPVGKIYDAPCDVYLSDINVYQPDLFFVANEHASILTPKGAEGAPDWIAEILSPSTAKLDLGPKHKTYRATGVKELWIIDPESHRIQVFYLKENADLPVATYDRADTITSPCFPELTIDCQEVFAE